MKKTILLSLVLSLVVGVPLFTLTGVAADSSNNERGYLSTSYSTEKEVSPDTVEFSIAVRTDDKKSMQEASRKNKEISNKVYEYLKSNITPANGDYVKTSNFNATPVYIYNNGKRIFDKYEVSNNIIVHTKSIDKVSALIDKSITFGATNVNSLNFSLSNKDTQCAELLSKAGKQVRERANVVASSVGTTVTGVKNIRTSCSLNQRRVAFGISNMKLMRANSMDAAAPEAVAQTDIEAGNITIYANVDADFFVK